MFDQRQLQYERGVNERYRVELRRRMDDDALMRAIVTALPRSSFWTGASVGQRPMAVVQPLLGRVALDVDDPDLGRDFYIGSYYQQDGATIVVSYAAPIASLFYHGSRSTHDVACHVVARRTFDRSDIDLTGYTDDIDRPSPVNPFSMDSSSGPIVSPSPRPIARPVAVPSVTATEPAMPSAEALAHGVSGARSPQPELERAADLVMHAISAPRTGALRSLLATLQPDQYDLVTAPDDQSLVIQGHPGTGKTVIAVHRASYLTHPERECSAGWNRDAKVLVLGPSTRYVQHVRPIVEELSAGDVTVLSMPQLYSRLGKFPIAETAPRGSRIGTSYDPLGSALGLAADDYRGRADVEDFVGWLLADWSRRPAVHADVAGFIQSLGRWDDAVEQPEFHLFLAAAALAVEGSDLVGEYQHIVVDEAQDLRPLDWVIVRRLLASGGTWTIVGDMNQRRSEHTASTWDEVIDFLDLRSGSETPLREISTGYRSTNQILAFAAALLRGAEPSSALRDGSEPMVIRVSPADLVERSASSALELIRRLGGLVAVISCDPVRVQDHFRRAGLEMVSSRRAWREASSDGVVVVSHPDDARGLEFDGVVVVEPAEFTPNHDRFGSLYTSLTRATSELVVVHARALPGRLGNTKR